MVATPHTRAFQHLTRAYDGLTPHERAAMVAQAWKRGEDYRDLYKTVPEKDEPEFERLIGLFRATSGPLAWMADLSEQQVENCAVRLGWLVSALRAEPPADEPSPTIEQLQADLRFGIRSAWKQLMVVTSCSDAIAEQLNGEDPLHPEMRSVLTDMEERLMNLHALAQQVTGEFTLEAPAPADYRAVESLMYEDAFGST